MRRITKNGQTICEFPGRYVDYPKLYKELTGMEVDVKEYRASGKICELSITDFLETNNLNVECWDKL